MFGNFRKNDAGWRTRSHLQSVEPLRELRLAIRGNTEPYFRKGLKLNIFRKLRALYYLMNPWRTLKEPFYHSLWKKNKVFKWLTRADCRSRSIEIYYLCRRKSKGSRNYIPGVKISSFLTVKNNDTVTLGAFSQEESLPVRVPGTQKFLTFGAGTKGARIISPGTTITPSTEKRVGTILPGEPGSAVVPDPEIA